MQAIRDFIALNGYGAYVWPAFGVAALVLAWMVIDTLRRLRASESLLDDMQKDEAQ
jgi:heme exporter protein D